MTSPLQTSQLKYLHRNTPAVNGIMPLAAFLKAATVVQQALGLVVPPELEHLDKHEGLEGVVEQAGGALQTISDGTAEQRLSRGDTDLEKALITLTTYIAITHRVLQKTPASLIQAAANTVELSSMLPRNFVADVDVQTVGAAND